MRLRIPLYLFIIIFNLVSHKLFYAQVYEWAKGIGGNSLDQGYSITLDIFGNVYVTGSFGGTVDFDPGIGTANLTSNGSNDIFIAKYDINGNYMWANHIGGSLSDKSQSIIVNNSGDIYVTGSFGGTADFDPGIGTVNLTSNGSYDIFIAKYDSNGNYILANRIGGSASDQAQSISVNNSGNIYVAGYFRGTADFDPGSGTAILISNGLEDIFIAKYDDNGNYMWANQIGDSLSDKAQSINVNSSGGAYVTGSFGGTADFDPGNGAAYLISNGLEDIFIAKYDDNGNYIWANQIGDSASDYGLAISVNSSGDAYITGYFGGTADFDPGSGTANLICNGSIDIFLASYDADGSYNWAKSMGSNLQDGGTSLTLDSLDNVHIVGWFEGTADFDPGSGTTNLISNGDRDIFISKYDNYGHFLWAKNLGSSDMEMAYSIALDNSRNIYVTGFFSDTVDFDLDTGIVNLTSNGVVDIFATKYSPCIVNTLVTVSDTTLTANAIGASYQWVDCDNGNAPILGQTHQSFVADSNHNYAVIVTQNECTDISECYSINTTGIRLISSNLDFFVYPNPAKSNINLTLSKKQNKGYIFVRNLLGEQVLADKYFNEHITNLNIDIAKLKPGIYIIQIKTSTEINFAKLVKE